MHKSIEQGNTRFLLVFGMARSGTSWTGKIFDSHPLTLYKHEPDRQMPRIPLAPRLDQEGHLRGAITSYVDQLLNDNRDHVAGSLPVFPKEYRSTVGQYVHRTGVLTATLASSLDFQLPVCQCAKPHRSDIQLVWKLIDSLGRLGIILRVVENCRGIIITCHPCGSISSTLRGQARGKFESSVPPSEDYGVMQMLLESSPRTRGLTLDHLGRFHPVERMRWIWVLMNEKAAAEAAQTGRCMAVRYEDVCHNPISKSRELFAFAGLPWSEQTSQFTKASRLGVRPGKFDQLTQDSRRYYSLFRDPVQSANKWKREMRDEDVQRVYHVLRQSDLIRLYPEAEEKQVQATA